MDILLAAELGLVVDVWSFPRSCSNPSFNIEALPGYLAGYQIGYRHMLPLGGRSGP